MPRYLAFAAVLLAAGVAQASDKTFDRTFNVAAGGTLNVEADGAIVQVAGSDANTVVVHVTLKGSDEDLANTKVDAVQEGNGVNVSVRRSNHGWFNSWHGEQRVEVTVPTHYAVNVRTAGGNIELRDTVGKASLNTAGGDVNARNLTGNVDLRTSGGTIHADTIRGDVDADTSGGDVNLLHIDGKIHGSTSGGSMRYSLVGANRGIFAKTSGGDIDIALPPAATGTLDASTNGGRIKSELPIAALEKDETTLKGTFNGGGEPIYAHTSGGSVHVRAGN